MKAKGLNPAVTTAIESAAVAMPTVATSLADLLSGIAADAEEVAGLLVSPISVDTMTLLHEIAGRSYARAQRAATLDGAHDAYSRNEERLRSVLADAQRIVEQELLLAARRRQYAPLFRAIVSGIR